MAEETGINQTSGDWKAAAITGGSNFLSTIFNQIFYRRNQRFAQEQQKEMFDYEHQANIADWNMENEYNLPANQYQRYIDAGLTPAAAAQAVAGQDGGQAVAPNTSSGNAPSTPYPTADFGNSVSHAMIGSRQAAIQESLAAAEIRLKNVQAGQIIDLTPVMKEELRSIVAKNNSEVLKNESLAKQFDEETKRLGIINEFERDKIKKDIELLQVSIREKEQAIKNMKQQVVESKQRVEESEALESLYNAEANLKTTEEQGHVYKNYVAMVDAMKADKERLVIDVLKVNPSSPAYEQLMQAGSQGELAAYCNAICDYIDTIDSAAKGNFPIGYNVAKGALLYKGYDWWRDNQQDSGLNTLRALKDVVGVAGQFSAGSAVNPIGFAR